MFVNLLLVVIIAALVLSLIENHKELKDQKSMQREMEFMQNIIDTYDKSDKVIKNCVVYTPLPVNITGSNETFISCTFESLGETMPSVELGNILGLKA